MRKPGATLAEWFALPEVPDWAPRYNIAPSQPVATLVRTAEDPGPRFRIHRWGLIPSWAKDPRIGDRMINAQAETVATKPSFRVAFRRRRCLVLADGFYEWQALGRRKQPLYVRMRDDRPFAFAGLWEHWESGAGETIDSCTLLTMEPNELIRTFHHRMPVILDTQDYARWLDPAIQDPAALQPILRPYPAEAMIAHPVSTLVNNPSNDLPECISPLK